MMEEELRQEAEGYFETSCPYSYADTEDDLKHDVTEAYMAGAEPREKRIKELEKENAELEKACEETQELLDKQIAVTYKLVEENAELRTKTTALENVVRSKEQLTKAKKIIKNLLDVAKFYNHYRDKGAVMDITPIYDAEQFLKEAEK